VRLSAVSSSASYNFGIALVPDLAYFVLFLPMVLVLVFLPQGYSGRVQL
jgi:branched-chain amino acid transport system permease protein